MVFDVSEITNLGPFTERKEKERDLYLKDDKVFLVLNRNTLEVRCDPRLSDNLKTKYESVMESRFFGRGGIEIVLANQLDWQQLQDLVRLSYNLTN